MWQGDRETSAFLNISFSPVYPGKRELTIVKDDFKYEEILT